MEYSKHNIFSRISGSEDFYLVNVLSGQADVLNVLEAEKYTSRKALSDPVYVQKGYVVDPAEEEKRYRKAYLSFIDERENEEVQLFFVPWYTCNFNCSYCFQDEYTNQNEAVKPEVVEHFYQYVDKAFAARKKYVTIFGGEPLLTAPAKRETIQRLIEGANARSLDIAVVTNGYHLLDYVDLLKTARIREIQVTVDGTAEIHDKRRMLKGGKGTFSEIAKGVDALLTNGMPVNLRVIIDKENIHNLPKLAQFAIDAGWTQSPLFKTGLGRNYELHHCQTQNTRLFQRLEMYEEIYKVIKKHPQVLQFHKPAFSVARFLFENGELPHPLFDSCSGTKTEWAFDYTGRIYACTATVGNRGDELGTFYPEVKIDDDRIEEWEERDILSIEKCTQCALQLACGGGCAAIAKNRSGKLHAPDCRPVEGLLTLGIGLYSQLEV